MSHYFSRDAEAMRPSPIRRLSKYAADPEFISFAGGHPHPSTFPKEDIAKILNEMAREVPSEGLQYGMTRGMPSLIDAVRDYLRLRNIEVRQNELILTGGSQRGLDLVGRVLFDPDDVLLVEIPTYPGALAAFGNLRVQFAGVRQDDGGIIIDELRNTLGRLSSQGKKPKALYTVANFQNPSGVTMIQSRRRSLARIADEFDLIIIEDDPYGELYFDDENAELTRPIYLEARERTLYLSSFSKIFAPGLRTGLICGPEKIIDRIELAAQASDLCSSQLDQYIIAKMLMSGAIQKNIPDIRKHYRNQCSTFLELLERYMPEGARWNKPHGGFFLWLQFQGINSEALLEKAIDKKVLFVPGHHFCVDGSGKDAMRLSYSKESPDRMEQGIAILGELLSSQG